MKKFYYSLLLLVITINVFAQIPDPCTGAAAAVVVDAASPCNCAESKSGSNCNKSIFISQLACDAVIQNYFSSQAGYGQPTLPVAWQDVRSSNMLVNVSTPGIKHEFSTEFTTGPSTTSVSLINIFQVRNGCAGTCQIYQLNKKSDACGTNLITPTFTASLTTPSVNYRTYTVSPSTTYTVLRQVYYDGSSAPCFSSWTGTDLSVSGGAKVTAQHWFIWSGTGVVAINNIKLTAKQINNAVMLEWSAFQENNNATFEVEKSTDGVNFIKYETVPTKGNTTTQNNYWLEDKSPGQLNYYRIKAVGIDGKVSYSSVVKIALQIKETATIIISPNPVASNADIFFESKINEMGNYSILNTMGNIILTGKISLQKGMNKVTKNVLGLAAGTYLFLLNAGGERISVKFVKE